MEVENGAHLQSPLQGGKSNNPMPYPNGAFVYLPTLTDLLNYTSFVGNGRPMECLGIGFSCRILGYHPLRRFGTLNDRLQLTQDLTGQGFVCLRWLRPPMGQRPKEGDFQIKKKTKTNMTMDIQKKWKNSQNGDLEVEFPFQRGDVHQHD